MTDSRNKNTEFIDTLIKAYNSMDQDGKEKLNEIAMSIYISVNKDKKFNKNEKLSDINSSEKTSDDSSKNVDNTQTRSNRTKLSDLFNSLKALSQVNKQD